MNTKDRVGFVLLGFIVWAAATLVYRMTGSYFFEGSAAGYWLNVIITDILFGGYSSLIGVSWVISAKAISQSGSDEQLISTEQ